VWTWRRKALQGSVGSGPHPRVPTEARVRYHAQHQEEGRETCASPAARKAEKGRGGELRKAGKGRGGELNFCDKTVVYFCYVFGDGTKKCKKRRRTKIKK
jgi:hypothetical protein